MEITKVGCKTYKRLDKYFLKSLRNGVLFVLAWMTWVVCWRGWHARVSSVGGVCGVFVWVLRLRRWHANVGDVSAWMAWVVCQWVVCQWGWGGWCANVGCVLKWVTLMILEEILGWCAKQYRGWRIILWSVLFRTLCNCSMFSVLVHLAYLEFKSFQ